MRISTTIITLNEEKNIRACIESVSEVSDEIIVVDSFSTDKTEEICADLGVTLIQKEWLGYSKAKNFAADQASSSIILSIDADERLDKEAVNELLRIKNEGFNYWAYQLKRKNFIGDKWIRYCGWYPDWKPRLYDKAKVKWIGDHVHEVLDVPENKCGQLDGNINHLTFSHPNQQKQTVEKYAKLAADKAIHKKKKLYLLKSVLSSISVFVKIYIFKLGFMEGTIGLHIATQSARSKWLRYRYFRALKTKPSQAR